MEGNITFHTAMSTAFPQPKPGAAPSPGPMTVPADQLHHLLGITSVRCVRRHPPLAIVDAALDSAADASSPQEPVADSGKLQVNIDIFR